MEYTLKCSAKGFPVPEIRWMFKPCSTFEDCDNGQTKNLQVFILFYLRGFQFREKERDLIDHMQLNVNQMSQCLNVLLITKLNEN